MFDGKGIRGLVLTALLAGATGAMAQTPRFDIRDYVVEGSTLLPGTMPAGRLSM